ncbi:MAG: hypothetical protein M1526_05305 [Candidatus Thermoplasmatota archaeon]|jgi:hypothetical protein|nr:hypothetical protein [Candidatus Thermoplasmatota archaeon]MCL5681282.1 hypothetical protein [Candidatus Thermoplasmatota archaeon]
MAEEDGNDKITIELKVTIPNMSKTMTGTVDHLLKALEEMLKAGRSFVEPPEVKTKVKKVDIK